MKSKIIVENIRVPIAVQDGEILEIARKRLKQNAVSFIPDSLHIHRKSVDARRRGKIAFVCSVLAYSEEDAKQLPSLQNIKVRQEESFSLPMGEEVLPGRPVVVLSLIHI